MDERTLGADAVELLSQLIRIDTVNPPGNEGPAQELLAGLLSGAGFECQTLEAEPGRPNLIARLPGEAEGPTLCFLSHVDTVPANPDEWSFDPWSGDVRDGFVLGRGGQDMKDQVATEVAAAVHLGRSGWRPARGELQGHRHRRRGDGRPPRRALAVRGASRGGVCRPGCQRGRRGDVRAGWAALLQRRGRREGRLPLQAACARARGPRQRAEPRRQRAPAAGPGADEA